MSLACLCRRILTNHHKKPENGACEESKLSSADSRVVALLDEYFHSEHNRSRSDGLTFHNLLLVAP
jgi:hypothetical protein